MSGMDRINPKLGPAAALLAAGVLIAGCAAANKTTSTAVSSTSGSSGSMAGMNMSGSSGSMAGMKTSGSVASVNGIKPVPTQVLATSTWEGMRITAQAMTPVPFLVYNGTSEHMVKPTPKTSFHLMVMLNDAHTGVPIPYASVWATISKGGTVVSDERQWPMISAFMGPHYGNDVSVPGAGTYQLTLLVSPPVSARHVEYQNVWLGPHRVTVNFHWKPVS